MKKTLAILMALVMVLGACTFASAEVKTYKVGISIYQYTDNFMTLYRTELENYLTGMGHTVTVVDGKNDQAEQTNQINSFIAQGVDVLIVNLVQSTAAATVIDLAAAADIPVVFINREPVAEDLAIWEKVCYVGADARQSGTYQGELILATANQGDINGDGKISYIMIQGDPENIDAQYRTEFSVKALTDAGKTVECLDSQVGNWDQTKGQELCANALTVHGYDVEVVFCNNDGMAMGALTAIQTAGRIVGEDIYLVGVDALPEAVEAIKLGDMTGTVLNDHIGQSHAAVDVAVQLLKGEEIQNYYWVNYVKVDKAYAEAQ